VIYTGITAGAFNTNTPLFIAFPAFYLPPVLCLLYIMLQQTSEGFAELAGLFIVYIILMYLSAIKFHNRLAYSLKIRFENECLAKQLSESNQKLSQLAEIDELTNLHNRRSMDKYLSSEWNRHLRNQQPLSLLFIDIDYFKQFNDTYGHEGGDQCLIQVSKILQNNAKRSADIAARFGGEEFALILPETGEKQAYTIAENIRDDLASLRIPHESSSVSRYLTVSIGVMTLIPNTVNNASLLRALADEALYRAKEEGRNCIIKGEIS
jgi:diguanylate cyclase (GGDEF)-like protein